MASNETLALTAQVIDRYSQPIRDMTRSLRTMSEHGKAVHVEGARYAKAHAEEFQGLRKTMRETSEQVKGIFQPAMVGLGLSAIGTGAAIAALAKGIKDLGAYGKEMSFASHETGLAINSLNAWIEAGKRANITSEAMIGSLTSTNEKLSQFEKRRDSALQSFFAVNMDKPVFQKLEHDLRAAAGDREKQDRLILDTYASLKEADQHLLEEAFGEQNFRRFNSKDIDANAKKLHQFTDEQIEDLKKQQEAFEDTAAAARKFAQEIELSFSKPVKEAADEVKAFIDEHGDDLKKFLGEVADDIKSADWKGFAEGIGKTATETKKLIDAVGGANVFQGLLALKLGGLPGLAALGAYKAAGAAKEKLDESGLASGLDRKKGESVGDWLGRLVAPDGNKMLRDMPIEKQSYRGRIPDLPGGGFQHAAYRTGEETPGAEIRAEGTVYRATMRGTAEGSRIGVLNAFREWMDERRRGAGIQTAAYHPGGAAGEGGLGGGYGGLGGGAGGGLGGGSGGGLGGGAPSGAAPAAHGPHGHPGQHAILEGHVKEAAATIKAAKAQAAADSLVGSAGSLTKLIDQESRRAGIDPRIMEGIRAGESGHTSRYDSNTKGGESSWGPFQLNRAGGSGNEFERDTAAERKRLGLGDLRDPRTIPLQARWVANYIKRHKAANPNWSPFPNWQGFHGLRNADPRWGESGYKPTGDAPEEANAAKPNDYSKIMPHDRRGVGESVPGAGIKEKGYTDYFPGKGYYTPPGDWPGGAPHKDASALKDNMTTAEINAWNEAHKYGTGPGQIPPPRGASIRDRLSGAHKAHAEHEKVGGGDVIALAEGGSATRGRPYLVGENGPELFVPGQSGAVVNNTNLGNIRQYAKDASGKLVQAGFKHFRDEFEAAHAIIKTMSTIPKRLGGKETIASIMEHYSPRSENDTSYLIKKLSERTGIGKNEKLDFMDRTTRAALAYGISVQEGKAREGSLEKFQGMFSHEGERSHLRSTFGHPHQDLLGNARKAGMMGNQSQKVTGEASMRIDLRGFPKGTKTKTEMSGMFSQIRVARGRAMPLANQDS